MSVRAVTYCHLYSLQQKLLERILQQHPDCINNLLVNMMGACEQPCSPDPVARRANGRAPSRRWNSRPSLLKRLWASLSDGYSHNTRSHYYDYNCYPIWSNLQGSDTTWGGIFVGSNSVPPPPLQPSPHSLLPHIILIHIQINSINNLDFLKTIIRLVIW